MTTKKKKISFAAKEARRNRAWDLSIQGYTHQSIAKILSDEGLGSYSTGTIGRIIHQAAEKMFAELRDKTDLMKTQKSHQLEHIYQESMRAYRLTSIETYEKKIKGKTVMKKRRIPGDARFLAAALTAMDRYIKLWGLDTAQKINLTNVNLTADLTSYLELKKKMEEEITPEMEKWRKDKLEGQKQITVIPDAEVIPQIAEKEKVI